MNTSLKFEAEYAELSRKKYRAEYEHATLPTTHPLSRHVQRVVSRLLSASNLGVLHGDSSDNPVPVLPFVQGRDGNLYGSTVKWDVIVVNDRRIINALTTPGLIVVFTGILPLCRNEEGLAAVLAHEIGHVVARHTAERISSHRPMLLFQSLLQLLRSASDSAGAIPRNGFQFSNSQVQEREADLIGLRIMSKACYNPRSALDFLSRLAHFESKILSNRNFTFTHPSSLSRLESLEEAIPAGYAIMATNPDCSHVRQQLEEFDDIVHEINKI